MIVQSILTGILLLFFYAYGILFKKVFPETPKFHSFYLLGGVLSVSLIGTITAFFFPLNKYFEIGLIVIACIIAFFHTNQFKNFFNFIRKLQKEFYIFCFLGLLVAVTYPFILDHFGYYVPTVKWLVFNGYQKGISNFEWVLAQNSAWHTLQASLNEVLDYTYRLNFVLFVIFNLYVFEKKEFKLLLFIPLFLFFINSTSPDLPILIFTIVLINEYILSNKNQSFYLVISAFLVFIKPIAIILPLYFLIELIRSNKNLVDKNTFGVVGLMLIFFAKNIIISANPIFPFEIGNLTFLEWSSPSIMYEVSSQYGKLIPLKEMFSSEEISNMNSLSYLKNIFFSSNLRSLLLSFIVCFTIILSISSFTIKRYKKFTYLYFALLIKITIVLISSAQFRFLLDVMIVNMLVLLIVIQSKKFDTYVTKVVFVIGFFLLIGFNLGNYMSKEYNQLGTISFIKPLEFENILTPSNYKKVNYKKKSIGNLEVNYSEEYSLMYNGNIPTLSSSTLYDILLRYNYYPQLIDEYKLKSGFKSVELDHSTKQKIEEILKHKKSE